MAESCVEKTFPCRITGGATKPLVVPAAARGKSCHRMRGDTQMRPRLQTQMRPRLQTHEITISNESTSTGWQVRVRTSYSSWRSCSQALPAPQDHYLPLGMPCKLGPFPHLPPTARCVKWHPCPRGDRAGIWALKHHISF